jgi:hypothetical protein
MSGSGGRLTARCAEGLTGHCDVPEEELPPLLRPAPTASGGTGRPATKAALDDQLLGQ